MDIEKTRSEIEKNRKYLHQLESLVKTLYPDYHIYNPYDTYLKDYLDELDISDVLLFKRLLRAITIMSHKERPLDGRRYICSYGDVLTTMELMGRHKIDDKMLHSYTELKYVFQDRPFTKLQASRVLRKSVRYVERLLGLLKPLMLAEKTHIKQGAKHTYRLLGHQMDL